MEIASATLRVRTIHGNDECNVCFTYTMKNDCEGKYKYEGVKVRIEVVAPEIAATLMAAPGHEGRRRRE